MFTRLLCGGLFIGTKTGQSKITNYAKRTQFFKKSNVYNLNKNNELQQKMDNGHLVKTNPIKPNFIRLRRTCPPMAGLPATPFGGNP